VTWQVKSGTGQDGRWLEWITQANALVAAWEDTYAERMLMPAEARALAESFARAFERAFERGRQLGG
jgi:hypothetical protein